MEPKDINFAAMPQTAVNVVTKPAEFFQEMPKIGGFLEPLAFVIIMGVITGIIQAILSFIGLGHGAGYRGGIMASFSVIIFMPIFAAIGSFIGAAILFVIWKLMGSQENYETAYRCGAYLMALSPITTIIGVVPYAGGIITMAIYVFYLVTASVHVHNIPSQKAWLVFGIIGVIFVIFGLFAEHKVRNMGSEMGRWREMSENMRKEYQDTTKDRGKSFDEMLKQAEEMA
ncbi:MAG: YIP1 family protein [Deltaproteobacteria bacterium]|nr:YIP1 family protein [Deltaproteobacteria bacterium]